MNIINIINKIMNIINKRQGESNSIKGSVSCQI